MRLFHGTNAVFAEIDLAKSNHFKDFGRGFYLTDIRQQAAELSQKRAYRDGGTPVVQEYEFDENLLNMLGLKVLRFEGPIADDGVAYLLDRYEEGSFTIEELARELKYKKLNNQYYFGSNRAISHLKRIK